MKPYLTKILCGTAIGGVIATAVTSSLATRKAIDRLNKNDVKNLDKKEKVKVVAKYYIPPILVISGTISCIAIAEHANAKTIAATSAALTLVKKSYEKYGQAVEKAFGVDGKNIIKKELIDMGENKIEFDPSDNREVYWIGYGYDDYFLATPEEIEIAEANLNKRLHKGLPVSMADFMEMLNLSPSSESVGMGWSRMELAIVLNTIDTDGDHPAQEIEFSSRPTTAFEDHHKWYVQGEPIDRTMPIDDEPPFDLG